MSTDRAHYYLFSRRDGSGEPIALVCVERKDGDLVQGTLTSHAFPDELRRLLQEQEEIIEGNTFSLLDDVQDRVAGWGLYVRGEQDIGEQEIFDLQVYFSDGGVSFLR